MQIAMLAGDLQKAHAKPVPLSSLIGSKGNLAPKMKSGFSVKKFTGASYHFISISTCLQVFILTLVPQTSQEACSI